MLFLIGTSRVRGRISTLLLVSGLAISAYAQRPPASPGEEMLRKYAGSYDTDALLHEPQIRERLLRLLGEELPHLERNLDVKGSIDVIGGVLSVSGNAPHQGTEEEAVVCVNATNLEVSAAILSRGIVTVYSAAGQYASLPLCVKDWITLANSAHHDRMTKPANVRLSGAM